MQSVRTDGAVGCQCVTVCCVTAGVRELSNYFTFRKFIYLLNDAAKADVGEGRNVYRESMKERHHLKDQGIDRTVLQWILVR